MNLCCHLTLDLNTSWIDFISPVEPMYNMCSSSWLWNAKEKNSNKPALPYWLLWNKPALQLLLERKEMDHEKIFWGYPLRNKASCICVLNGLSSFCICFNNFLITETTDENTAGLPFISWLASVTERINQTMHFQFSGKPEPLTFLIPQVSFFFLIGNWSIVIWWKYLTLYSYFYKCCKCFLC